MKVVNRFLLFLCCILCHHDRFFGQDYSHEALQELKQKAESCDSSGLAACEDLLTYYYRTGASPSDERRYISSMINCSQSLGDNGNLARAYNNLLYYYRYNASLDSLDVAIELLDELALVDTSIFVQSSKVAAALVKADYYYFMLDDVENGYRLYNELIKESYELQFYHIYLQAVLKIANYYSDDESYSKGIEFAKSRLAKLPDHNSPESHEFYYKTDIDAYEHALDRLQHATAVSILYDTNRDSVEVWNAYKVLQRIVKEQEQTNPYNAVISIMYILDRMTLLPIDTLLEYGNKGLRLDQTYDFQDNYIRTFHSENLIKIGKLGEAQKLLLEALEISKAQPNYYNEIADVYDNLATIALKRNQPEEARLKFDLHKVYKDSAYVRRKKNDIENVETKFALKEQEIENLRIEEEQVALSHRNKILSIMGGLIFLALMAAITFYVRMRKTAFRLAVLNEDKNKLFAILAHDLRNPIASLSNLSQKVKFLTEEGRLDELDTLAQNTDSKLRALNDNLNNILLWAITESNLVGVNPEKVSLQHEVNKINELYADAIKQKDIIIHNKLPSAEFVYTDLKVLQTILRNLINNAIKFSHSGGAIEFAVVREQAGLELRISDNGIGLHDTDKGQIESNTALRKKAQGTGIGLKISSELAAKVNLDLSLVPNPNGGTIGIIKFKTAA